MALPAGITPKTVTIGSALFFNGAVAEGSVTITAPVNVVYTTTNQPIFSSDMTAPLVAGSATFSLCPTDAAGLNRVDWVYKLKVTINGAITQPDPIYFTLPSAGPATVDLDSLVTVPSSAGTPVSVSVVTSVNGQTGDVTVAGGSGTVADATTTTKGIVQLAGDLAGTSAAPTVPGLTAAKARANHTGTQAASTITGLAAVATSGSASDITAGTLAPARMGSGTPSASTVLYGDGAWKTAPTGGGTSNGIIVAPAPSGDTTGATDSAALQALIDGISQSSLYYGGSIQLQPGLYCGNINMRPKVRIWGAGIGATRIIAPNGSTAPVIGTANRTTAWMGGVEIAHMTIDGNNIGRAMDGVTKSTSRGIDFYSGGNAGDGSFGTPASVFDHDPNPYFHNLAVVNCGSDGIYVGGVSTVGGNPAGLQAMIHHCILFNNWGFGILVDGPDCMIDNCQVGASRYDGVKINASGTSTISNVKSWYSGSYWDGVNYTQNAFYHGFYIKDLSFRCLLTGCTSEDNGGYAVRLENCQSVRVAAHSSAGNASGDVQLIGGTKNCKVDAMRQWTDLSPGGPLLNVDGATTTQNSVDVFCDNRLMPGTKISYTNSGAATGNVFTTN